MRRFRAFCQGSWSGALDLDGKIFGTLGFLLVTLLILWPGVGCGEKERLSIE
jgi:hypothetical protein